MLVSFGIGNDGVSLCYGSSSLSERSDLIRMLQTRKHKRGELKIHNR